MVGIISDSEREVLKKLSNGLPLTSNERTIKLRLKEKFNSILEASSYFFEDILLLEKVSGKKKLEPFIAPMLTKESFVDFVRSFLHDREISKKLAYEAFSRLPDTFGEMNEIIDDPIKGKKYLFDIMIAGMIPLHALEIGEEYKKRNKKIKYFGLRIPDETPVYCMNWAFRGLTAENMTKESAVEAFNKMKILHNLENSQKERKAILWFGRKCPIWESSVTRPNRKFTRKLLDKNILNIKMRKYELTERGKDVYSFLLVDSRKSKSLFD